MRLLVCGFRAWSDVARVEAELALLAPEVVIHGAAQGADAIAHRYARDHGIGPVPYPADWATDGRAAGPKRNARMLAEGKPDRGLAFGALWKRDGRTPIRGHLAGWAKTGTGDMVLRMLAAGVPVRWIEAPDTPAVDLTTMPGPR